MSSVYDALIKAGRKNETISAFSLSWQAVSLEGKTTILVVGLIFVVIVNLLVARVLRTQMDESAVLISTNLSDAAAGYLASKDMLRLNTTVTKYARLSRVAYVFIQDRHGQVIAHSLATFFPELQKELTSEQGRHGGRRELTLQGKAVYETREPILEGQLGTAHIGIWADEVERDIYQALFLFVWPITLGLLAAVIIVAILARPLIRSLRRLIELRLGPHVTSTRPSE
jgi:sensor histidine kinase regulating citrate/malate metabolism